MSYSLPYAFGIIKGPSVKRGEALEILAQLTRRGFTLLRFTSTTIYTEQCGKLHLPEERRLDNFEVMSSTYRIVPFVVTFRKNVLASRRELAQLVGDSLHASACSGGTIRHMFGGFRCRSELPDNVDNVIHLTESERHMQDEEDLFFDRAMWME